jgi:hypothetical protein
MSYYTSRLLNYVEPYYIDGIAKTAFWSEVNTNIQKNDKVFIINGHYDSEQFISKGKWTKNADGYRVLFIDRCKIVLDIDWESGKFAGLTQTYREDSFDNYIKVHNIRSQREFDYINKINIDTYTASRVSKFEKNLTNHIIYSDRTWTASTGLGQNNGTDTTKSFWARDGVNWVAITNQYINNSFTFSSDYISKGLTNNGRLYILGEDIRYANTILKERNIYKWTGSASWVLDTEYKQPIISKLYFKEGVFRGIHNDGVFGSYRKKEIWSGTPSVWNSGFFVNSIWQAGKMNSKSTIFEQSYYSVLVNGQPVQTTDFSNNRGYGYNYVLDSDILTGQMSNGNFLNSNIGIYDIGMTAVSEYFGVTNSYQVSVDGGFYEYCDINNSLIGQSTTLDSIIKNSKLQNTRAVNSQIKESYSVGGEFSTTEGSINVVRADLASYMTFSSSATYSSIRGILKLYIRDNDLNRLDNLDSFYISRMNKEYILSKLDSDLRIWLPLETRYILDTFFDFNVNNIEQECFATLKSKKDNKYLPIVQWSGSVYSNTSISNPIENLASIDIDLSNYLAFYYYQNQFYSVNQNYLDRSTTDSVFANTTLTNSDFRDGLIDGINWNSGSHVNPPSNIIKLQNGLPKITKFSDTEIKVYLDSAKPTVNDSTLRKGQYVWLDSIRHTNNLGTQSDLTGVYQVSTYSSDELILKSNSLIGMSASGTFSVLGGLKPTYLSVHRLLIQNSKIINGLFIRNLFRNTLFEDETFNNNDTQLNNTNVQKLRVLNHYFINSASSSNTVRSGVFHNSHFINVDWQSGIADNSIWLGPDFKGGIFNYGIWRNGTFSGGRFQNSRGLTFSPEDYTYETTFYRNWYKGTFDGGEVFNSVWLDGTFNLGKFYNSDWYGGVWNNGILGDNSTPTAYTTMAKFLNIGTGSTQTFWYNGMVENAEVGGQGYIDWYDGKFNSGIFSSSASNSMTHSIWYNGQFNGGNFTGLAKWKDGIFNSGKFNSYYGYTLSNSTQSIDYSWESGEFRGGQFGEESYGTNSTWWDGQFYGGIFKGRVWNSGIFLGGLFEGSGSFSVISETTNFTEMFTQSYWGLWRSGTVTELKHKANPAFVVPVNSLRFDEQVQPAYVTLKNLLWLDGIFNHPNGEIINSAWLKGKFKKGKFKSGVFNPYVRRNYWDPNFTSAKSFNLNLADCIWENGDFDGVFYISDWLNGNFNFGTMSGARWFDGVWKYGNARNIYWENGTWKNGNWDGSPFDLNTLTFTQSENRMNSGMEKDILTRVANVHQDGKIHVINAFSGTFSELVFDSWTFSDTSAVLTDWVSTTNGWYLPVSLPTFPTIDVTNIQYNTPDGFNTTTVTVGGGVVVNDEYRVYMYGGYISITASNSDTTSTIADRLINEINTGVYSPIVKFEQWTANGYLIRLLTWGQIDSRLGSFLPYAEITITPNVFTIVSPADTNPYVQGISGFVPNSVYTQSEKIYALIDDGMGLTATVFTQSGILHNVSLDVYNYYGRTDFAVNIGPDRYLETLTTTGGKTLNYSLTTTDIDSATESSIYVERIMYSNPDNSSFEVQNLKITRLETNYDTINNTLYQFGTYSEPFGYGASGPTVSLPGHLITGVIADNEKVSIKYGNGIFKYGLWENGYWNNGWYASWGNDVEYYLYEDVVLGGFLEVSPNRWIIIIKALTNTDGLEIGNRVSIGNIVFIDVNENRRVVRKWYRVVNKTSDTITVEIDINFTLRRIEKDSSLHLIYISKKIWQFGIFHNGFFRGIWNYGLFRGYPYITVMDKTQWIDGIFDGGTFKSTKSTYLSQGASQSYNNALIQNFTFRDNNVADAGQFKYNSWIDANYFTFSMTNLLRDNLRFDNDWGVILSSGNLKGYPSEDVLSSKSIFRNALDLDKKYYSLGTKYKIYNDFLKASAYFTYPFNTNGAPGVNEFLANGWTYTANFIDLHSNAKTSDENVLQVNYSKESYSKIGIKFVQINKLRYTNNNIHIIDDEPEVIIGGPLPDGASWKGDFSSTAKNVVQINDVNQPDIKFSNVSYNFSSWPLRTELSGQQKLSFDIQNKVNFVAYNNSGAGTPVSSNFTILGDTVLSKRRVYQFDRYNLPSFDPQFGGYYNNSNPVGFSFSLNPVSSNVGGAAPQQMNYKVQRDTRLRMNVLVPFKFFATEKDTAGFFSGSSDIRHRFGWSVFKLIGVIEKYPQGQSTFTEDKWQFVTSTELNFYPDSAQGYVDRKGNLIGFVVDRANCTIAFDSTYQDGVWPPASNKYFKGYLQITNFEADFKTNDLIRFRLYWLDIRKMFTSTHQNGRGAPGYMDLIIGKDTDIPYNENNHGYFEITDLSTYTNQNTNLLDNVKANAIEKFRYSVLDFDLAQEPQVKSQGTSSVFPDTLPNLFLLNSDYPNLPGNMQNVVINHGTSRGNKKEYFYNRKSLNLFFKSVEAFSAKFSKLQFYETDMIPFFHYTDEESVNKEPQSPYYGTAPLEPIPEGSLSLDTISYTSPFEGDLRGVPVIPGGGGQGGGGNVPTPPVTPPSVTYNVLYVMENNTESGVNEFTSYYRIREYNTSNTLLRTIEISHSGTDTFDSTITVQQGDYLQFFIAATYSVVPNLHISSILIYSGATLVSSNSSFPNSITTVQQTYTPISNLTVYMKVDPDEPIYTFTGSGYGNSTGLACSDAVANDRTLYSDCQVLNTGCEIYLDAFKTPLVGNMNLYIGAPALSAGNWIIDPVTGIVQGVDLDSC